MLANKGPLCLAAAELETQAQRADRELRYEATVMAGTPAISLAREGIAGSGIREARGILNGTCNYILTQMEAGAGYHEALAQAQAQGYAEADPRADVEGHDAAGKASFSHGRCSDIRCAWTSCRCRELPASMRPTLRRRGLPASAGNWSRP